MATKSLSPACRTIERHVQKRLAICQMPLYLTVKWRDRLKRKKFVVLLLLTLGALAVHGYHPWAEDSEIYLPGVEKILHPELFPFNAQFFEAHARSTFFPNFIAASVRLTHLPLSVVLLSWHLLSIFLLLLGCRELLERCFTDEKARWAGVAMVATLLTLPVAGTALYIMDQYVNPRNLSAFASVFSVVKILDKQYVRAILFLLFAAAIHPFMSSFVLSFCALLIFMERRDLAAASLGVAFPFGLSLEPPSPAYHQVALTHGFHYVTRWQWYEWLGIVGPIAILWWFSRIARTRQMRNLDILCRALIIYEVIFLPAAVLLSVPARFESLARLQPMRCLYLLYILLVLFVGGFLGQYVLRNRVWRWLALFVPLCAGMFFAQRMLFPASPHIELPGAAPKNPWVEAFLWVRGNTPSNAIFALDPLHVHIPGEDTNGFRAIAQRSMLADGVADSGATTMFPPIAEEWLRQTQAQSGWKTFQLQDFRRLQTDYGVNWVVLQQPGIAGIDCPYQNEAVRVCRL